MKEDRISNKIMEIEKFLEELESVLPQDLEEYKKDFKIKDICERRFEKIVEAVVDLAFFVIKKKELKSPDDDKHVFKILEDSNIISSNLSKKLQDAKCMRNVIAHEYGRIDDELVFEAVTEQIIGDVREFIKCVKRLK